MVEVEGVYFTYIHNKTTPLKNVEDDLIYSLDFNPSLNHSRSIFKPRNKLQSRVLWFFKHDKVFFQDNEVGDTISNFIKLCAKV